MRAILTYHSIDSSGSPLSVSPEQFRRHLDWLAASVVRVVPLGELVALPDGVDAVALTFDDALASVASEAAAPLRGHGFPATVFVTTRHVGRDNRWASHAHGGVPVFRVLDWNALGKLAEEGLEIGAHSRSHARLPACDDEQLEGELLGAAEDIEQALSRRPTAFAYPYGLVDGRVASATAAAYQLACTTELRPLRVGEARERLPRLDAYYFREAGQLERWGSQAFRRYLSFRRTLRRVREALA